MKKNVEQELRELEGMNNKRLALLAKNNVITLDDFAGLSTFDLLDKEDGIFRSLETDEKSINEMIMKAREKWFVDEKTTESNEKKDESLKEEAKAETTSSEKLDE